MGDWVTKNLVEDTDDGDTETIGNIIPETLESTLQTIICNQNLEAQYHLIRFFYAQSDNVMMNVEFMVDNQEDAAEEEKQLASLPWLRREAYYSIRRSIMLKPLDSA